MHGYVGEITLWIQTKVFVEMPWWVASLSNSRICTLLNVNLYATKHTFSSTWKSSEKDACAWRARVRGLGKCKLLIIDWFEVLGDESEA